MAKYEYWLTDEGLQKLEEYAVKGMTDVQISKAIGINRDTLKEWKKKYPAISATLKKGKAVPDDAVENALLKSALGYDYEEVTRESFFNRKTGEWEMRETKRVVKHVQPSNTAQIFWLKNRRPDKWRDKTETAVSVNRDDVIAEMEQYFHDEGTGTVAPKE